MWDLLFAIGVGILAGAVISLTIEAVYKNIIYPLFCQRPAISEIEAVSLGSLKKCVNSAIASTMDPSRKQMYQSVLNALESGLADSTVIAMGHDKQDNINYYNKMVGEPASDFSSCIQRFDRYGNVTKIPLYR